ncbi:MAG: SH3 domain-containing protein [Chloroflexi bacterium]|nr:MAG: SH3 domain-containing protein [Chloroflexota bacterium]MBL1196379.1 SH3 domain-containing protein [Chloroflexota bacterium]NOH13674.1 SH3 domain-containing protein [Chloroflexota bacterium]
MAAMLRAYLRILMRPVVALGALGIAVFMFLLLALAFWLTTPPPSPVVEQPTAILTVIPPPTPTPRVSTPTPFLTATPTDAPLVFGPGGFTLGSYVQIAGTSGDGLNIRSSAGLNSEILFLGLDSEIFEVRDGPVEADGFIWWLLVTPIDENRSGWAADAFLEFVENP